jgi:hypothetical protein
MAGDRVHEEQNVGEFPHHLGNFRKRVHEARGGLVEDQGYGIEFSRFELGLHLFRPDGLVPRNLQGLAGDPASLGDLVPALGKGAVYEVQNLLFHAVPHRGLHHARGG